MTLARYISQLFISNIAPALALTMSAVSAYMYFRYEKLRKETRIQNEAVKIALYKSNVYEKQLRELIDLIPYPVFSKDHEQKFVTVNEAYANFFNLTPKDLEGQQDTAIYQINAYTPLSHFRVIEEEVLKHHKKMHLKEYLLTDANGIDHIYDIKKVPYPIMDQSEMGLLSIAVDITDLKRKENGRISALTRLVTNIAHQFNTPLGNVISSSSFLKMQNDEMMNKLSGSSLTCTELRQFLESVNDANKVTEMGLERLVAIVSAFKALSFSTENLVRTSFNLVELIQSVVEEASSFKAIAWRCHFDPLTQLTTYQNALEQVLSQLVSNAIEHAFQTPTKGDEIIDFYYHTEGDYAILKICDNGPGISEENLVHAFDPLFTSAQNYGHLGIGLSIAYNITCQLLDGDMNIKNRPEGGLEVTMKFRCH